MVREIRTLGLTVSALLLPALAVAQAPPPTKTPVAPKTEHLDPNACVHTDTLATVGKGGEIDTPSHKWRHACNPVAWHPRRGPNYSSEVTVPERFSARLLDSVCRRSLYRAHSGTLFSEWRGSSAG